MRNLITRIERLESQRPQPISHAHRVIQDVGEDYASACTRYERERGREIGADDLVIVRIIVD